MKKSKLLITFLILSILIPSFLIIYSFLKPNFSKKECKIIRQKFEKIKPEMSKKEVLLLIGKEPYYKIHKYSKIFPEQKNDWEFWMLCSDLDSCNVYNLFLKNCTRWQMLAFDTKTEKVTKVFYDSPERVGFF